jgi:hypothetical protein
MLSLNVKPKSLRQSFPPDRLPKIMKQDDNNLMVSDAFVHALTIIGRVMEAGATNHGNGEWLQHPTLYHVGRAMMHLRRLGDGDQSEDHLAHACCRLLMALSLRELK